MCHASTSLKELFELFIYLFILFVRNELMMIFSWKSFTSCPYSQFVTFMIFHNFLLLGLVSFHTELIGSSIFFFFFAASKARRPFQFAGKITVKAKEKSYSKLEIPYQAEVLEG